MPILISLIIENWKLIPLWHFPYNAGYTQEYCIPLDLCINIDKKQPPNAKYFGAINKIKVVECTLGTQKNMEILNLVYEQNHKHTAADFKHEA